MNGNWKKGSLAAVGAVLLALAGCAQPNDTEMYEGKHESASQQPLMRSCCDKAGSYASNCNTYYGGTSSCSTSANADGSNSMTCTCSYSGGSTSSSTTCASCDV